MTNTDGDFASTEGLVVRRSIRKHGIHARRLPSMVVSPAWQAESRGNSGKHLAGHATLVSISLDENSTVGTEYMVGQVPVRRISS